MALSKTKWRKYKTMKMEMKKSAVDLTDLAVGIIVLGIVVSIGASVMLNVRDTNNKVPTAGCGLNATGGTTNPTYDQCNTAWQLGDKAATGLAEFGNWFNIIVIVGVAAVILSLIFMAFGKREGQGSLQY